MNYKIPLFKNVLDYDDLSAIDKSFNSEPDYQNQLVSNFESLLKDYFGGTDVVLVSSGTAALHVAFLSLNLSTEDLIFIPDYGWPSATNISLLMGFKVILVDVDKATLNIDLNDLESKILKYKSVNLNPKVLVHIHQFGLISDIDQSILIAKKNNMILIEDAACALGATYNGQQAGTFGDIGIFSFHPRKSITTGEGGALTSKNHSIIEKAKVLRNHGQEFLNGSRRFILPGLNYRLSFFQAAVGISQFAKLSIILSRRREIAYKYLEGLSKLSDYIILPKDSFGRTWQTFSFSLKNPIHTQGLLLHYYEHNINSIISSAGSSNLAETELLIKSAIPNSKYLLENNIAIPLYPSLSDEEIQLVISVTSNFFENKN